jgi:peptide/nickel transport system permease protein
MTVYVIRRLLQAALVIFIMTLIVFFGVNVIGNPIDILVDPDCDQACFEAAEKALGLDKPIVEQYFVFLENAVEGNLGKSFVIGMPALPLIVERMPATLELAFSAMFLAILTGIPLGMWAGLRPDSISGKVIMGGSILGFSLPSFWVGLMMIMIFAVEFGLLPSTGRGETVTVGGIRLSFLTLDGLSHMILPAVNLALYKISLVIRLTRAGMREALHQDYVKFARAKGLSTTRVIFIHVMKNILIPVVTILGLELGNVIAFAVVTETIFSWPGMGKLIIDSIQVLDRPVIVAYLMITVFMFIFINLVVDLLYSVIDPRVRLQGIKA